MKKISHVITILTLSLLLCSMSDYTHASSKKSDYGIGPDWDGESLGSIGFSDTASSYGGGNSQQQKLDDLHEIRKYMFKGFLEITPANYESVLNYTTMYESSFRLYNQGIFVKGWKSSLGTEHLVDLLLFFGHINKFKMTVVWDNENVDMSETICRGIQFFEKLGELTISGCRLTDDNMTDIMDSIRNPDILQILNVRENRLTSSSVSKIKERFLKLIDLKTDVSDDEARRKADEEHHQREQEKILQKKLEEDRIEAEKLRLQKEMQEKLNLEKRKIEQETEAKIRKEFEDKQNQQRLEAEKVEQQRIQREGEQRAAEQKRQEAIIKQKEDKEPTEKLRIQKEKEEKQRKDAEAEKQRLQREAEQKRQRELAETERQRQITLSRPIEKPIPEIARGYEEIYRRFMGGRLVFKPDPNSDDGKIEFPFSIFAQTLEGEFDLSRCIYTRKYTETVDKKILGIKTGTEVIQKTETINAYVNLSINIGYRKSKKPANANKIEIWITPKFVMEKALNTSAKHYGPIMTADKWTSPVGILWTYGNWSDTDGDCDYLTNKQFDEISTKNLYENWVSCSRVGSKACMMVPPTSSYAWTQVVYRHARVVQIYF